MDELTKNELERAKSALAQDQKLYGPKSTQVAGRLKALARILREAGATEEAAQYENKAQEIYEAPEMLDEDLPHSPDYRLFDGWAIGIATFFGGALAGGAVAAFNFHKLGDDKKAVICSVSCLVLEIGMKLFLKQLDLIGAIIVGVSLYQLFGITLAEHKRLGGKFHSRWWAFLVAVVVGGLASYIWK